MNRLIPELKQFIHSIPLQNYDLFIPVERKGMALIRYLLKDQNDIGLDVNKLLSSEAVEYLNPSWFEKKKVCFFDDTVFTGKKIFRQVADIEGRGAQADSSAFAVCSFSEYTPTFHYFDGLSLQDYAILRAEILGLIAESQILLLDTEHIGLRIHCTLSPTEIVERLRKLGGPLIVARVGADNKQFISIHAPPFFDEFLPHAEEPDGFNVFYKLRFLVQNDSTIWIVPIVFPPTPTPTSYQDCPMHKDTNDRDICLCGDFPDESIKPLYCRSLYWSARLLTVTVGRLKSIMEFDYDLNDRQDFPVEHLKALFPMLDLQKWKSWLTELIASTPISAYEAKANMENSVIHYEAETDGVIRQLLNILLEQYEKVEIERLAFENDKWLGKEKFAVSYDDLFARFVTVPKYFVSQALDILIDQSIIIPTEMKTKRDGKTYWVRGARLDGEYTYYQARRVRRSLQRSLGA